jgi:hypothetical protein
MNYYYLPYANMLFVVEGYTFRYICKASLHSLREAFNLNLITRALYHARIQQICWFGC